MPTRLITFPGQSGNDVGVYKSVSDAYFEALESEATRVIFDCSKVHFFRPFGLNLLAALISKFLHRGAETGIIFPEDVNVCRYLEDQGFNKAFQLTGDRLHPVPRSTSVSLRRMDQLEPTYFDEVLYWILGNSNLPEQSVKDIIRINLTEIINNVLDHSESEIGCYISAQAYPKEDHLEFSVLDLGIGFLGSLRPVYPELSNNAEAITLAVQEGVSSKTSQRRRGVGLSVIREFLLPRGRLKIISREGQWRQEKGGLIRKQTLGFSFPGTCVTLNFDRHSIATLYTQEELDEMVPFE